MESVSWALSTPGGGGVTSEVTLDALSPKELHSKADQIKGRIVLIDTENAFAEGFNKTYPS